MSTGSSYLKGTLNTLLTFHIGKVEITGVLLCIEFFSGIDNCWFKDSTPVEEADDVG